MLYDNANKKGGFHYMMFLYNYLYLLYVIKVSFINYPVVVKFGFSKFIPLIDAFYTYRAGKSII